MFLYALKLTYFLIGSYRRLWSIFLFINAVFLKKEIENVKQEHPFPNSLYIEYAKGGIPRPENTEYKTSIELEY